MHSSPKHLTAVEFEQGLAEVLLSPKDNGLLKAVFVRPKANERQTPTSANLSPEGGLEGDRWATDIGRHSPMAGPIRNRKSR